MLYSIRWFFSFLSTVLRLGAGQPGKPSDANTALPILYEFSACPWCRIAREAISEAGLSVVVRPCPKGGTRFRPAVKEMGGKAQFPFIISEHKPDGLYESADIARMVRHVYGGRRPILHWLGPINGILSSYAILLGFTGGRAVAKSQPQTQPLELHGSEANPSARLIKARLSSLELEYVWHPGKRGQPCLIDPSTEQKMEGAPKALSYLRTQYSR